MERRSPLPIRLLVVLLLAILPVYAAPARAAQPGEELISSSGAVPANKTITMTLYSSGPANIRLEVGGGAAGDKMTMSLASGGAPSMTWDVQSGEVGWATADLPSTSQLSLRNNSATPLTFSLKAYALGVAPNIAVGVPAWSGTASGDGSHSTIRLSVPASGLYRFTTAAASGSYQIQVDGNYILKTVAQGKTPDPADSTYYLTGGVHTLTILQAPGVVTAWSVALAGASPADTLPATESSAVLGGGPFSEEWAPIQVAKGEQVNFKIAVTGAATDRVVVALHNASRATAVFTSTAVYGGETVWGSGTLADGANALHVIASGAGAVGYTITVLPIAQAPASLDGTSYGAPAHPSGGNSAVMITFPKAGLYTFNLGASAGRYQLRLNDRYLQKTVTTAGAAFSAYVAAGTFPLSVAQDPGAASTGWSVAVAPAGAAADSLPYVRTGATLGGTGNAFTEEWLPIQAPAGSPVNVKVTATGAAADSFQVELYQGDKQTYSIAKVYGDEVFWGTSALASGGNLLHIVAPAANSGQMSYQVEVQPINTIAGAWSGTSLGDGLNSILTVKAPVAGTYNFTVTVSAGSGQLLVDQGATAALRTSAQGVGVTGTTTVLRVPLTAGLHRLTFKQDPALSPTTWEIAANLRKMGTTSIYIPLTRR